MRRQRHLWPSLLALGLATVCTGAARAAVLYDGSGNTLPSAQGWAYLTDPIITAQATQTAAGGATTLDTTAFTTDKAGYFSQLPIPGQPSIAPTLDRSAGYTVRFTVQVLEDNHDGSDKDDPDTIPDRAGLSLIVLSSDSVGIELGFWSDEVWAQSVGFYHAEGAAFDTASAAVTYDLFIQGNAYTLTVGQTPLLSGALRDYSSFGPPYSLTDFLFVGDNTTTADGAFAWSYLEVLVPEPGSALLFAAGLAMVARWRRRAA